MAQKTDAKAAAASMRDALRGLMEATEHLLGHDTTPADGEVSDGVCNFCEQDSTLESSAAQDVCPDNPILAPWLKAEAALAQPSAPAERNVPALTLERVRAVLTEHVYEGHGGYVCRCHKAEAHLGNNVEQWTQHVLALLAAPETEKPR